MLYWCYLVYFYCLVFFHVLVYMLFKLCISIFSSTSLFLLIYLFICLLIYLFTISLQGIPLWAHDYVFWCGDFNYRINLTRDEVIDYVQRREWGHLLQYDQLKVTPCIVLFAVSCLYNLITKIITSVKSLFLGMLCLLCFAFSTFFSLNHCIFASVTFKKN